VDQVVLEDVVDGVAVLTLNRPDRLNAWTGDMEQQYFDCLEGCAASPEVRAIVVTGAGRGFCAGADMNDLQALGDGEIDPAHQAPRRPQSLPHSIPKPIIAAINGPCAGIGLVQALMCDLRFAAEGAKITTAFARRGLVAEHGISWILPRLVGPAAALDLLLSARVVMPDEALRLGLVNRVFAPERLIDETLAYAAELAVRSSPASMAASKAQVYADLERGIEEATARADRLMVESFAAPDFAEGVTSFLERRDPDFAPLAAEPGAIRAGSPAGG
jgi:enoyl-CoA hydratase/carnithine racemase